MLVNIKKILVSAAVLASFSTLSNSTASATSLSGATVGGTSSTDYFVYDVSNNNTVKVPSTQANIQKVLSGNATNPTGNVELAASSEQTGEQTGFDFSKNTSLNGTLGGRSITLSSLTQADWNTTVGGQTFGKKWFGELLAANNISLSTSVQNSAFQAFVLNGGLQRFSDPNISYVNQGNDDIIRIGLAGHYNATSIIQKSLPSAFASLLNGKTIQASEIVKVTYNGETSQYLYSFKATNSGLVSKDDGISHSGNYEVTLKGKTPKPVPESSMVFGLISIGGMLVAKRKLIKTA